MSRVVDFWYASIFEGYIVESAVKGFVSFSIAERKLFWGPCRRYINLVPLWIKMLLCEKGVMSMENESMCG